MPVTANQVKAFVKQWEQKNGPLNGGGLMTADELLVFFKTLDPTWTKNELDSILEQKEICKDKDGKISVSRFIDWCLDTNPQKSSKMDLLTRGPTLMKGFKVNMEQDAKELEYAHPEVRYGGQIVPCLPFHVGAKARCLAEIDLSALSHNVNQIQRMAADTHCKLISVLKADAYGHGAVAVAHVLYKCNGVDFFAVATVNEAIELRLSGIPPLGAHILVLGATDESEWPLYSQYGLDMAVNSGEMAEKIIKWAEGAYGAGQLLYPIRVHVILNTGMSRLGLQTFDASDIAQSTEATETRGKDQTYHGVHAEACAEVIRRIDAVNKEALQFVAIMTHMCDAKKGSPYTLQQFDKFCKVVNAVRAHGVRIPMIHCENSESLLGDLIPDEVMQELLHGKDGSVCDTVGYCRSGGGIYGQRNYDFLRPVVKLKAQVRHTLIAEKGVPVGYDRSWTAPEDVVIATVAIGFADGYNRGFSNAGSYGVGATVGVHGELCQIAGKVCMDMMMINCGPKDGVAGSKVKPGDYVVLFGKGGPSLKAAAALLGTAQSDLTCDFMRRIERHYINFPQPLVDHKRSTAASMKATAGFLSLSRSASPNP